MLGKTLNPAEPTTVEAAPVAADAAGGGGGGGGGSGSGGGGGGMGLFPPLELRTLPNALANPFAKLRSEASQNPSSGRGCEALLMSLFGSGTVDAASIAAQCSKEVEWVDMGASTPARGPAAVAALLEAKFPPGSGMAIERISDGARSGAVRDLNTRGSQPIRDLNMQLFGIQGSGTQGPGTWGLGTQGPGTWGLGTQEFHLLHEGGAAKIRDLAAISLPSRRSIHGRR